MRRLRFLFVLVLLLAALGCQAIEPPTSNEGTIEPTPEKSYAGTTPAPEFGEKLIWLNTDRPLSLAQLRGKVVLLDFWTYGCINCIHVIPDLKKLEEQYAAELVVIGVHSAKFTNEKDTENIRQIILRYELEHPVINDRDFQVWQTFGAEAWPTFVLIDPAGNYVGHHSGEGIYDLFDQVIGGLVREFDAKGEIDRTPLTLKLEKEGLPQTVLAFPGKVLADGSNNRLFIADTNHNRIVVVDAATGEVQQVIGNGAAGFGDGAFGVARFFHPQGMALDAGKAVLYVADTENHAIRRVDLNTQQVETIAGTGEQTRMYPGESGPGTRIALNSPWDLQLISGELFIAMAGSHQLWVMNLEDALIGPYAGSGREALTDGPLTSAALNQPSGLATDGQRLYVADSEASAIRTVDLASGGSVGTIVGTGLFDFGDVDGVGDDVRLQHPLGVVYYEGKLYVADTYNSKLKVIEPEGRTATTLLGGEPGWRDGPSPLFYEPGGLAIANGKLYIADTNNHSIRIVDLTTLETRTLTLTGIERFMASAEEENFRGQVIEMEAMEVREGKGEIVLNVMVPEGYKINAFAPFNMEWTVDGNAIILATDANRSIIDPAFPLTLEATFKSGESTLTTDLLIYYCEAIKESVCLIQQARLIVPLQVTSSGNTTIELDYAIPLPDLDF
ncbi:MAG: redoxin domain-containing protein [Ardenticatenales bacterium]|nr:redoxin domain-containing protein [Ardenticatenales bacterium]